MRGGGAYPWFVFCENCYGPVKDSTQIEKLQGWSFTSRDHAVEDWDEQVVDYREEAADVAR